MSASIQTTDAPTTTYYEKSNLDIAKKLENISMDDYLSLCDSENTEEMAGDAQSWLGIMRTLCKKMRRSTNNVVPVQYKFAKNSDKGRKYAKGASLQQIKREFRGILCDGIYYDFDMKNAHPVILNNIALSNNILVKEEVITTTPNGEVRQIINFECLNYYCNNRQECIESLCNDDSMDKDEAKLMFIKSINSEFKVEKYKKKKIKNKFFIKFDEEIKILMNKIIEVMKDEYENFCRTNKGNLRGKFMSFLCRNEEALILDKVNEKYEISVLMYDGFMIECEKVDDIEAMIIDLNKITVEYGIIWTNKKHDISILNEVKELVYTDKFEAIEDNLEDIAKQLFDNIYKEKLCWNSGNIWYKSNKGWINNDKAIKRQIFNEMTSHDLFKKTKDLFGNIIFVRVCEVREYKDLTTFIMNWAEENNKLLNEIQIFCFGKLFFQNGYYDIQENTFVPSDNFNTLKRIEKEFNPDKASLKEDIKEVFKTILDPIFTCDKKGDKVRRKLRDNFLYNMSRVVFGYYQDKNWFSMDGLRDGGKGMITELLEKTFESYICATHGENFLYKPATGGDEARNKSFLIDFIGARLVVCNEIKIDKNTCFDGNKIKSFCSGGDTQSARKCYQDEQYFKLECSLMFFANDLPEIKPADAKERQTEYSLCSKFCDEETYEEKKQEVSKSFRYYPKDDTLKMRISNENLQMAFIHILIDSFNKGKVDYPEELSKDNETDETDDYKTFYSYFNLEDQKETDRITLKDINAIVKERGLLFQSKKIKQLLINKGCEFRKTSKGQCCIGASWNEDYE